MSVKVELDYGKLDALLQFKVSLEFCADYLGVSRDTVLRRIKEDHGMSFGEYHQLKIQKTATKLQQKAIEMALAGNATMLIFSLKNLAMWKDKVEHDIEDKLKEAIQIHVDKQDNDL